MNAGIEAWQRADYATAVAIWRPFAEKGDPDAQFNLGQAYRLGRGVPINLGAAQTWFQRAAEKGHLDAQTTLGLLLFQNGNHTGGIRWIKLAAEKGEPRAMLVYGTALFNGDGVPQDQIRGYAYVRGAASKQLQAAQSTLADLDRLMSLEDRKKGAAVNIGGAAPTPGKKTAAKVPPPLTKPTNVKAPTVLASPAKPRPAPAIAAGGWRIQLGAFSQRASAEALFHKLSGKLAGRQAYYVPAGAVTRLQVGPYETKAAAAAACQVIGQACFPVPGK